MGQPQHLGGTALLLVWNPNPTVDVASEIASLRVGDVHAASEQTVSPGGKGTLVLGALAQLQTDCLGIAPIAGVTGRVFEALVRERELPMEVTAVDGMTRVAVSLVERTRAAATVINGPGPQTDSRAWLRHVARVEELAGSGTFKYVAVAGRPPTTAPDDLTARICRVARGAGAKTVIDVASPVLENALRERPWLVKVNLLEAEQVTGPSADALQAAARLKGAGADHAIVTDGPHPVGADFMGEQVLVAPPVVATRSAVGCGDCFLAGILHALHAPVTASAALYQAIAIAAAAAETLAPGDFKLARASELLTSLAGAPVATWSRA